MARWVGGCLIPHAELEKLLRRASTKATEILDADGLIRPKKQQRPGVQATPGHSCNSLWITEGIKKVDAARSRGFCAISSTHSRWWHTRPRQPEAEGDGTALGGQPCT
jgi:hypothetical protein